MKEDLNENAIEEAYWEFDKRRKSGAVSERDSFKYQVRKLLRDQRKALIKKLGG